MKDANSLRWSFQSSQEYFHGRVHRIAIYLQSKVLEIIDSNDSVFYLLYFKNILLGGGAIEHIKDDTFLHEAFQKGMILSPAHPLFPVLLPKDRKITIPNTNHIFTQLQNDLSLQEIAHTATFMDSFIEKPQLIAVIRQIFDHFRRNGQFLKAYQMAKIIQQFSPQDHTVKQLIKSREFDKYKNMEETDPATLLEQDSIYAERFYFHQLHQRKYEIKLHLLLEQQSRPLDQLLLYFHEFECNQDVFQYEKFSQLLRNKLKPEERYAALLYLWERAPEHPVLTEELFQEQIHLNLYPDALQLMVRLTPKNLAISNEMVETIFEHVDPSSLPNMKEMNKIIKGLYSAHPKKKDDLVRRLVMGLLQQHNPAEVKKWLEPIRETSPTLPVIREVDQLEKWSQDVDQLTNLGKLYYQFHLLDQSIECFTWEMELNPTSSEPVRWLSLLHREKGMIQEADNYKNLSILLAKNE